MHKKQKETETDAEQNDEGETHAHEPEAFATTRHARAGRIHPESSMCGRIGARGPGRIQPWPVSSTFSSDH